MKKKMLKQIEPFGRGKNLWLHIHIIMQTSKRKSNDDNEINLFVWNIWLYFDGFLFESLFSDWANSFDSIYYEIEKKRTATLKIQKTGRIVGYLWIHSVWNYILQYPIKHWKKITSKNSLSVYLYVSNNHLNEILLF